MAPPTAMTNKPAARPPITAPNVFLLANVVPGLLGERLAQGIIPLVGLESFLESLGEIL